jgi:hypothetical protein
METMLLPSTDGRTIVVRIDVRQATGPFIPAMNDGAFWRCFCKVAGLS